MAKSVTVTPEISQQIQNSVGDPEFDTSNLTVFETILVSTEPVQKRGTIFEGARIAPGVLIRAAEVVNSEGGAVPIHTLHQQGQELPVGRLFQAEVREREGGEMELRGLFYLPNDQEQLISSINNNTIDEVSVGLKSQQILCSECDFDFLGENSDIVNILERTCDNGHEIGKDGCHARLVGLDQFLETSLVSRGAAQNAKILSRSKQKIGSAEQERLAANGLGPEVAVLTATTMLSAKERTEPMAEQPEQGQGGGGQIDLNGLIKQVTDLSASVATKDLEINELKGQISAKDQEIENLKAKIPEDDQDHVKAALGEDTETVKAKIAERDNALTKLQEHAKAALVASGEDNPSVPDTTAKCLEVIEEKGLKLHQVIGQGQGKSGEAASQDVQTSTKARKLPGAFKVTRQ